MYIIKHKTLPYYLTWELDDKSFSFYKDQIEMEMKENGLSGFEIREVDGSKFDKIMSHNVTSSTGESKPVVELQDDKPNDEPDSDIPSDNKVYKKPVKVEKNKSQGKGPRRVKRSTPERVTRTKKEPKRKNKPMTKGKLFSKPTK